MDSQNEMVLSMMTYFTEGNLVSTTVTASLFSLVVFHFLVRRKRREPASGKCILVTGCDSGFGANLVESASNAGFTVVAACYTDAGAKKCNEKANVTAVVADLTTKKGRMKVVAQTKQVCEPFGGLYAIVNNAGGRQTGLIEMMDPEVYEKTMSLMFHAPIELTYELIPLIKNVKGRLVFLTSVLGLLPITFNGAYAATKHAIEAYCDVLRVEMRPWGVKVVVVEPGGMKTPLVKADVDNFRKTYTNAPRDRQEEYGQEWLERNAALLEFNLSNFCEDPIIVTKDLMDALLLRRPPTRILSGLVARFVIKPMSLLPDFLRDVAVVCMMGGAKSVPKALQ